MLLNPGPGQVVVIAIIRRRVNWINTNNNNTRISNNTTTNNSIAIVTGSITIGQYNRWGAQYWNHRQDTINHTIDNNNKHTYNTTYIHNDNNN